jgi:hypothetical protein
MRGTFNRPLVFRIDDGETLSARRHVQQRIAVDRSGHRGNGRRAMSNLVDRLRMQANAFINLNLVAVAWTGSELSHEETAIITDLREAANRIAGLEMALVELSQIGSLPRNESSSELLAVRVRMAARRALKEARP